MSTYKSIFEGSRFDKNIIGREAITDNYSSCMLRLRRISTGVRDIEIG
jgi:hypothetical protein